MIKNLFFGRNIVNQLTKTNKSIYPFADPQSEKEIVASVHAPQWMDSKQNEMEEIWEKNTYILVPRPPTGRVIGTRFIYKYKWRKNEDEKKASGQNPYVIERFKARWIAQGVNMIKGIHYREKYVLGRNGKIKIEYK